MNAVHGLSFVLHHIVVRADVILRKSRFEADIKLEDLLGGVSAEAEISEAVGDGFSFVGGDALEHMGVVPDHEIGAVVDGEFG